MSAVLLFNTNSSFAVCTENLATDYIQVFRSKHSEAKVHTKDPYYMSMAATHIKWRGEHWQASHDFLSIEYPSGIEQAPITNGFLHVVRIGYRNQAITNKKHTILWEFEPTLAVSSNQLKYPDELEFSAMRFEGHVIWKSTVENNIYHYAGLCSNTLTGEYQLIPTLGLGWRNLNNAISIAYPKTNVSINLYRQTALIMEWSLSGNMWEILDADLQNRSDLHFESQTIDVGLRLHSSSLGIFAFSWSYRYKQQLAYLSRSGEFKRVDVDNTHGWTISYRYSY